MRKSITSLILAGLMALGGVGVGIAAADPGPHHGHNIRGLCRAYFAGSEQGREQKRQAPPFQALEEAADEQGQSVQEYCEENGGFDTGKPESGPGSGNGNG